MPPPRGGCQTARVQSRTLGHTGVNVSPLCLGASLQRLGTDHIDLDQVHRPEAEANVNPSDAGWSNLTRELAAGRR